MDKFFALLLLPKGVGGGGGGGLRGGYEWKVVGGANGGNVERYFLLCR